MMYRYLAKKNGKKLKVFQILSSQLKPADTSDNLQCVSCVRHILLLYFVTALCVYFCVCSVERANGQKSFKMNREAPSMLQLFESLGFLGNLDSANLGFLSLTSLRSAICTWSNLQCLFLKTSLF